jgi:hypothetical protein
MFVRDTRAEKGTKEVESGQKIKIRGGRRERKEPCEL